MITPKTLLAAQLIARRHAQKVAESKKAAPPKEPHESPEWRGFLAALQENWAVAA